MLRVAGVIAWLLISTAAQATTITYSGTGLVNGAGIYRSTYLGGNCVTSECWDISTTRDTATFSEPQAAVSFEVYDVVVGTFFGARAYAEDGTLLGSQGLVNFGDFSSRPISATIYFSSDTALIKSVNWGSAGHFELRYYGIRNFTTIAPVPIPPAALLFLSALVILTAKAAQRARRTLSSTHWSRATYERSRYS